MTSQSAPWNPMNFDPNGVRETYAKMFLTLWNVHKFHLDYAVLDNFDYSKDFIPVDKRNALDRWILSRFLLLLKTIMTNMSHGNSIKLQEN